MIYAAGTPAGTVITNQATVTFNYGSDPLPTTVLSNVVSITVAQVAAVNLAPATGTESSRLNTVVDYPFVLVNSGNGTDRFSLTWVSSLGFSAQVYEDANGDQILNPAEIGAGAVTQTPDMTEDRSMNFVLRLSIPDSLALTGQTDVLALTATSLFDPAKRAALSRSTSIMGAVLTLQKSVNRTIPRAGDRVMYTIAYGNTGNAAATGIRLTDALDGRLRYVTGSASPAPDTVYGQTLRWNSMGAPAWGSGVIMFEVDILNNVPAATEIHNVVAGQYLDGQNVRPVSSTERNFMTVQSSGVVTVAVGPDTTANSEAGDTLQYGFLIVNNGALPETFDLSYTSTQGIVWSFYEDPNGTGHVDAGSASISSTGALAGGARYYIVAKTVLPLIALDQTVDFTTFRVQSTTNQSNFKTVSGSTTIGIPRMSLVKDASAPDPLSGKEIIYTITYVNSGHGGAYDFAVTDSIPANTAYVQQSAKLNGMSRTDEVDQDEVSVSGGVITVNLGTVPPNGSGVIEFRVRIL
jgi:uncharacterized repeat protein (TIGR01451 family)